MVRWLGLPGEALEPAEGPSPSRLLAVLRPQGTSLRLHGSVEGADAPDGFAATPAGAADEAMRRRLVDALPNGPRNHPTVQVFMAGGVPEVMLHLREMGLLHLDVMTASGRTLDGGSAPDVARGRYEGEQANASRLSGVDGHRLSNGRTAFVGAPAGPAPAAADAKLAASATRVGRTRAKRLLTRLSRTARSPDGSAAPARAQATTTSRRVPVSNGLFRRSARIGSLDLVRLGR